MSTASRRFDEATRRGGRALLDLGGEIRRAREAAGLSQERVALAGQVSHTLVSRIEHGDPGVPFLHLVRVAAAVGLDVSLRAFPGPDPVRDRGQLGLLERFRALLAPGLSMPTEVPLPTPGDQRAWDAVVIGAGPPIGVEAVARLLDVQAVDRRVHLKLRDSGLDRAILLLGDTRHNRHVLRTIGDALTVSYPVRSQTMVDALAQGLDPGGSGIVLL